MNPLELRAKLYALSDSSASASIVDSIADFLTELQGRIEALEAAAETTEQPSENKGVGFIRWHDKTNPDERGVWHASSKLTEEEAIIQFEEMTHQELALEWIEGFADSKNKRPVKLPTVWVVEKSTRSLNYVLICLAADEQTARKHAEFAAKWEKVGTTGKWTFDRTTHHWWAYTSDGFSSVRYYEKEIATS